jgi:hypothetical protein
MFLLYHSEGYNICEMAYVNDLHTTTCSGVLGLHMKAVVIRHRLEDSYRLC